MKRVAATGCVLTFGLSLAGCVALPSPTPEPSASSSPSHRAVEVEQPEPAFEGGFAARELVADYGGDLPSEVSYEQLTELYATSAAGLPDPLPTGFRYPRNPPGYQPGDGAMYESSLADAIALDVWRCSWLQIVSEAQPDGDASSAALRHLEGYGELPQSYTVDLAAYEEYWEQRVQSHASVADAATSELEAGCSGMIERD